MANIKGIKRGFGYDPVSRSLRLYVDGVHVDDFSASTNIRYYVDQASGSDSYDGRSWASSFLTFQKGVTAATHADYTYKDVDLYVGAGEYDEEVVIGCSAQDTCQAASRTLWKGYKMGLLRIICNTKAVVFKNSSLQASHTLDVLRLKTEIYGGTWRNYNDAAGKSAIHFERSDSGTYGDVINAKLIGAKLEGRNNDSATAKTNVGLDIDAAQYVWVEDCWFSGWDTGILVAGNSLGSCNEVIVKDCYFRTNTNDIEMGASTFTMIEDCKFMDDSTTKYVTDSDWSSRGGTPTDTYVCGGFCAAANLDKFDSTNLDAMAVGINDPVTVGTTEAHASKGG